MSHEIPLSPLGAARMRFLAQKGRSAEPGPGRPLLPHRIVEAALSREGGAEQLQLAWEVARCAPSLDPDGQRALPILVLGLLAAQAEGSTRLSLRPADLAERLAPLGASPADVEAALHLIAAARAGGPGSEVIGAPGEYKPLLVAGGHLYAQRMLGLEDRVARALLSRLRPAGGVSAGGVSAGGVSGAVAGGGSPGAPAGGAGVAKSVSSLEEALAEVLARPSFRGGRPTHLTDEQRRAVVAAASRPLAVISGGPGTGKTSIVVAILRVLLRCGLPLEAVALGAPTGKAANRMKESIEASLREIADPAPADLGLLEALPKPQTLHRLLGYSPSRDRFRHHENNPLAERVVIVDEASMIDLFVFERLVRAVRLDAHLVLLGDADQLPSVEAGAVFRDLLPRDDAPPDDPRRGAAVSLTQSFRMDPRDPHGRAILTVARAIHRGRLHEVLREPAAAAPVVMPGHDPGGAAPGDPGGFREAGRTPPDLPPRGGDAGPAARGGSPPGDDPVGGAGERVRIVRRVRAAEVEFAGVELLSAGSAEARERQALFERWFERNGGKRFERWARPTFRRVDGKFGEAEAAEFERAFRHHGSFRILCLARGDAGGTGARAVNRALHLLAAGPGGGDDPIPGEPVLVRRNDYERNLFNGDQGLVLRVADHGGRGRPMVVFPGQDGFRAFPLEAMRGDLDLAWAMTVHRSQGSEFERVLVVLPNEDGPLLTRELLYTAATRAKQSVVFAGPPHLLAVAAGRALRRTTGIEERLAAGEVP